MVDTIEQIALATVTALAPFIPLLTDVGKTAAEKLAEAIAQKGGEAAWERAQNIWDTLRKHLGGDSVVNSAVTVVADKSVDETRQNILVAVLSTRLRENPALTQDLFDLLGGQKTIQQILADHSSWVEDVTQHMRGENKGQQNVQASDDSVIKGVRQIRE